MAMKNIVNGNDPTLFTEIYGDDKKTKKKILTAKGIKFHHDLVWRYIANRFRNNMNDIPISRYRIYMDAYKKTTSKAALESVKADAEKLGLKL